MLEEIKLIALDLDGTLIRRDNKPSNITKTALNNLRKSGVEVVISTGRRFRSAQMVIENLGFEAYCVCNGGALVKDPKQNTVLNSTFLPEEVLHITHLARKNNLAITAQRDSHTLGGADFIIDNHVDWHEGIQAYFDNNKAYADQADLLEAYQDQHSNFLALATFDTKARLENLVSELKDDARYNVTLVSQIGGDAHYCEITKCHVDKWHGLKHLAEIFDLKASNICAVGDELNDLAMVKAAGLGVAMENAHLQLKEVSDMVCGHHTEDGLLEVFDFIHKHNQNFSA